MDFIPLLLILGIGVCVLPFAFGGGSRSVAPAVEAPSETDPEVEEALRKERELARIRKGRRSTILTSPTGVSDETQKKTLLGG